MSTITLTPEQSSWLLRVLAFGRVPDFSVDAIIAQGGILDPWQVRIMLPAVQLSYPLVIEEPDLATWEHAATSDYRLLVRVEPCLEDGIVEP